MKSLALKILSLCVYDLKDDIIVKNFIDIGLKDEISAFTAYGNICRELLRKKQSLSEYLQCILLNADTVNIPPEFIKYDLSVINELCLFGAEKIVKYISEKFGSDTALSLPLFNSGEFDNDNFLNTPKYNKINIFSIYKAFITLNGNITPVPFPDTVKLSDLKEYTAQKEQIIKNTECFINEKKAQNVLLYGDRGTGKSSTIKALVNHYNSLKIIGADKKDIFFLPQLFEKLRNEEYKFIIFLDDLVFEAGDDSFNTLKQILEGSVVSKPDNVLIYATTNRRHIIKETVSDRDRDAFHRGDALDDIVSLSDRFGLYITFSLPDKELYIKIIKKLASDNMITVPYDMLEQQAEQYALKRGGRSPRIAKQFIEILSSDEEH